MRLIPFGQPSEAGQTVSAARAATRNLLRGSLRGVVQVASDQRENYLLALAAACGVHLDERFVEAASHACRYIGEANPRIPNFQCRAPARVIHQSKIRPGAHLPGVSACSVQVARRFDYVGPPSGSAAAALLLASFADQSGCVKTVAEAVIAEDEMARTLAELTGSSHVEALRQSLRNRLASAGQVAGVDPLEKQVFVPTRPEVDEYVVVTPLSSQLVSELWRRLDERQEQRFEVLEVALPHRADAGLTSNILGGRMRKLLCVPPGAPAPEQLPECSRRGGRYLLLAFEVQHANASGSDITAGLSGIVTAALGLADSLRRRHPLGQVDHVAAGVARASFHGFSQGDGVWRSEAGRGRRVNAGGRWQDFSLDPEWSGSVFLLVRLRDSLDQVPDGLLWGGRFAGGTMVGESAALVHDEDLPSVLEALGEVQFITGCADLAPQAGDKLDALLDEISMGQVVPLIGGYQGIEAARRRRGVRGGDQQRHMYAVSITKPAQWTAAKHANEAPIWWRWWRNNNLALEVVAEPMDQ